MKKTSRMKKALVTHTVEQSIFEIGGDKMFKEISERCLQTYKDDMTIFYRHPRYLNQILKKNCKGHHKRIINLIESKLNDFADSKQIRDFVAKIKQH